MDALTQTHFRNLYLKDREVQSAAYDYLLAATQQPVDWAYEAWDEVVSALRHKDNLVRAIAAQVLCNLVKSDPDGRILADFEALLAVTKDERFVTARHCMQSLWKIGLAGEAQQAMLVDGLTRRFHECAAEKNGSLIRHDIVVSLRTLYDAVHDERIRTTAQALVDSEEDLKYRKKYAGVWKTR
jgi:hypothetical protein